MKRQPVKILGRTIGACEGWDGELGEFSMFFQFQPTDGIDLSRCGTLYYNEYEGVIGDEDAPANQLKDVVELLKNVPRRSLYARPTGPGKPKPGDGVGADHDGTCQD